jgi:hypothetical protein
MGAPRTTPFLQSNRENEPSLTDNRISEGSRRDRESVRILRSAAEIEEVRETWKSWQYHPNSDIDFFLAVNRLRPQILRPHVVMLYRDGRPDAMLIGRIVNEQIDLKVGYKTILAPRTRTLRILHNGFLGNLSPANSEVLVSEILNTLRGGESDLAVLSHVRVDSPIYQAATKVPGFLSRDFFPQLQLHRSTTIPATVEDFHRRLSHKVRKNSKWKRLHRDFPGGIRIDCIRGSGGLERMIRDVEEIASKTYQRGLGVGFKDHAETRELLRLDAENGRLRAFILYLADRPCAFWLGTVYQGTFHGDYVGYDPEYGRYALGMFLMMRVIEGFCEGSHDVAQIDFGLGDAEYKEILGNCTSQEGSLCIFAPNLRGMGLNVRRTPVLLVDRLATAVLTRTRLIAKIKRAWRNRVKQRQHEPSEDGQSSGAPSASKVKPG